MAVISNYSFKELEIPETILISNFAASDERGESEKSYSFENMVENDICFIPQETLLISSRRGVVRGLHYQRVKPVDKLVQCIKGKIWCVVLDLRKENETFGKWVSIELDAEDKLAIYVPKGCAFGTLTLEAAQILCQCGEKFYPEYDSGIRWDDTDIGVKWPLKFMADNKPILSEKDMCLQTLRDYMKETE